MTEIHKKIFFTLFLAGFLLVFHVSAMKFSWYYLIYELDMFPHFLGGLVIFFTIRTFLDVFKKELRTTHVLLLVFIATIVWEIFEIYLDSRFGVEFARNFDSLSDIFLGMLGGLVGVFLTGKSQKNIYN